MFKKVISLVLMFVMVLVLSVGCGGEEPVEEATDPMIKVGMITDTGGLGDKSFNDSAWMGIEKAETEFNIGKSVLESDSADDYLPNLTAYASEGSDLTIGVGYLFEQSMIAVADQFPDSKFAVVDTVVDKDNVASLTFKEHEGSFLVGVIAGLTTETDTIGFIGGMKSPLIEKFEYGFKAGVESVNSDAVVLTQYADSFEDSAKGKEIALAQHQKGADVIYHAAGGVGIGMIQAATEQGFWAIGVDQDQALTIPEHADSILCSMIKRVDSGTHAVIKDLVEGNFTGKIYAFGIADEGVGYSDSADNTAPEVKAETDRWEKAIADGMFEVPYDMATFEAFEVPEI